VTKRLGKDHGWVLINKNRNYKSEYLSTQNEDKTLENNISLEGNIWYKGNLAAIERALEKCGWTLSKTTLSTTSKELS
jgi:transposase